MFHLQKILRIDRIDMFTMETYGENVGEDEQYEIEIPLAMKSNDDIDEYIKQKMAADFQTTSPPIFVARARTNP